MKRILLLLSLVVVTATMAFAVGITDLSGFNTSTKTLTVGDFKIECKKNSGSTEPTYNAAGKDIRVYAKGTVTISTTGDDMTEIVFSISTQGKKRLAPITASNGTIATQVSGDATVTWTGSAKSVTFTVGDKANYGSDGSTKAGQLCFDKLTIEGGPTLLPANLSFPEAEYTVNIGEAFTAPVLSKDTDVAPVYVSSNTAVATVDAATGAVTVLAKGTTEITATTAANNTYADGEAKYTLTVIDPNAVTGDVTFDFVNKEYGLVRSSSTFTTNATLTEAPVIATLAKSSGSGWRLWTDGLRAYKGSLSMKIEAPGYIITSIEMEVLSSSDFSVKFNNVSASATDNVFSWSGDAEAVNIALTMSANKAIKTIKVEYEKAGNPELLDANLKFPEASYTAVMGQAFEAPALTRDTDAAVSYASENEEVAKVDAATGAVTLVGPGRTTINATTEATDKYNAGKASYMLIVELGANNVLEIYAAGTEATCVVNFPMTVTYVNGANVYATDGTTATLIYVDNSDYVAGDIIPAGWKAQYAPFNQLPEIKPVDAMPAASGKGEFTPATVEAVNLDMVNEVVVLKNVTFAEATASGSTKVNFTGTTPDGTEYTFRNNFADVESVVAGDYNVTLAISRFNDNMQLLPIAYTALEAVPAVVCSYERNGENKVLVTLTLENGVEGDIYYHIEEIAAPAAVAAAAPAEGYQLYTEPIEVTKASTVSYYAEVDGRKGVAGSTEITESIITSVENIVVDGGEARYYDLNGRVVENPAAGVYIRVVGGKASKAIIR